MLDLFFTQPLIQLFRGVFNLFYLLLQNYGFALIALSLLSSFVLGRMSILVDGAVCKEKRIQAILHPQIQTIRAQSKGSEKQKRLQHLYQRYAYHPFYAIRLALPLLIQLPFLFAAYHMLSAYQELDGVSFWMLPNLGESDHLLAGINLLPIVMTAINGLNIALSPLSKKERIQASVIALLFLILLYQSPSALVLYWTLNNLFALIKTLLNKRQTHKKPYIKNTLTLEQEKCFFPALILIAGLFVFYFPLQFYFSDVREFKTSIFALLKIQTIHFMMLMYLGFALWAVLRLCGFLSLLAFVLCAFALTAIVNGFFFIPDVGAMESFVFHKPENLVCNSLTPDLLIIAGAFATVILLGYIHKLSALRFALNSASLAIALICAYQIAPFDYEKIINQSLNNEQLDAQALKDAYPKINRDLLTFSKQGKNIIMIMFDQIGSIDIKQMRAENPAFDNKLEGFTFYTDTLSVGTDTITGKPGLLGGEAATPLMLNKDRNQSLEEKINEQWAQFFNFMQQHGYQAGAYDYMWLKPEIIAKKTNPQMTLLSNTDSFWSDAGEYWRKKHKYEQFNYNQSTDYFLSVYGLFRIAPSFSKDYIYTGGDWLFSVDHNFHGGKAALENYANVASMAEFASVSDRQGNAFRFFINLIPHRPYISKGCQPNNDMFAQQNAYQYARECAFIAIEPLLNFLKNNNIYDNTMIILVSDHGEQLKDWTRDIFKQESIVPKLGRMDALLMVKPFNAHGPLQVDSKDLMMNYDARQLIINTLDPANAQTPWTNLKRKRCTVNVGGRINRDEHPKTHFEFSSTICIDGKFAPETFTNKHYQYEVIDKNSTD